MKSKNSRINIDNPGDYASRVGDDLYLNPWWALNFQSDKAKIFCEAMTEILGPPDLWHSDYWRLLWGPQNVHMSWRPQLFANLSGWNGKIWIKASLPWRSEYVPAFTKFTQYTPYGHAGLPARLTQDTPPAHGCTILSDNIHLTNEYMGLIRYAKLVGHDSIQTPKCVANLLEKELADSLEQLARGNQTLGMPLPRRSKGQF